MNEYGKYQNSLNDAPSGTWSVGDEIPGHTLAIIGWG
jgi:hypothetical protein